MFDVDVKSPAFEHLKLCFKVGAVGLVALGLFLLAISTDKGPLTTTIVGASLFIALPTLGFALFVAPYHAADLIEQSAVLRARALWIYAGWSLWPAVLIYSMENGLRALPGNFLTYLNGHGYAVLYGAVFFTVARIATKYVDIPPARLFAYFPLLTLAQQVFASSYTRDDSHLLEGVLYGEGTSGFYTYVLLLGSLTLGGLMGQASKRVAQ